MKKNENKKQKNKKTNMYTNTHLQTHTTHSDNKKIKIEKNRLERKQKRTHAYRRIHVKCNIK